MDEEVDKKLGEAIGGELDEVVAKEVSRELDRILKVR